MNDEIKEEMDALQDEMKRPAGSNTLESYIDPDEVDGD